MIYEMIAIVVVYGLSVGAVHVAAGRKPRRGASAAAQYVLYMKNDQRHVEWAVYSLLFVNWLRGQPVRIVIVDEGSSDDSPAIIRRLSKCYCVELVGADECQDALATTPCVHIRLHHPDDLQHMPEFYSIR